MLFLCSEWGKRRTKDIKVMLKMIVLIQMALCKPSVVTHTVIPALGKQRQEDYEFEASLG